jgi:hypothetical protein
MESMAPTNDDLRPVREALDAAEGVPADQALVHLRTAVERLTDLLDESLAEAVVEHGESLRSAGAKAGLSENAVGPRLARTRRLAAYASDKGRVTAAGVERAKYDAETAAPAAWSPSAGLRAASAPEPDAAERPPMRFKPRRPTR